MRKKRLIKESKIQNSDIQVLLTTHEGLARDIFALAQDFAASSTHVCELSGLQEIQERPA